MIQFIFTHHHTDIAGNHTSHNRAALSAANPQLETQLKEIYPDIDFVYIKDDEGLAAQRGSNYLAHIYLLPITEDEIVLYPIDCKPQKWTWGELVSLAQKGKVLATTREFNLQTIKIKQDEKV